jgi:hypothetical protein
MSEETWRDRKVPYTGNDKWYDDMMENSIGTSSVKETATGPKDSLGKPNWSIIPLDAVEFIIPAFEDGMKPENYGAPFTYRNGIPFSKLFAATMRHLIKWYFIKEQDDQKSKVHHLAHAGANILMIICNLGRSDCDDR